MTHDQICKALNENPELLVLMEEAIDAPSEAVQKATEMLRNRKENGDSTDMVRVRDYIENNDDIKVRIARKFSKDPCDPLTETIYEGMLSDIPEELRDLEVMSEGWMMDAQVNQLEVFIENGRR